MASKKTGKTREEAQRQSRKDLLIARKQAQQTKQIRLAMLAVAGLLGLIFVFAIVNEAFLAPNRAIAVVTGEEITLREWQRRVRYERAQRILLLENQLEAFGGDVGIIQQFAGQMIIELRDAEILAQDVLDRMVNETVIRQLAEAREINVTEEEIDEAIANQFNYFDGESPTPIPTATQTAIPTPSLTPVPTAVITEVLPTRTPFPTLTPGPTSTPRPTSTPVSEASFQEQLGEFLAEFRDMGVDEETYRSVVRASLYQEKLMDVLAVERELPQEADHVSVFLLTFDSEEAAGEAKDAITESDFVTVWNTLRTAPGEISVTGTASEVLWRTQEDLATSLGEAAAAAIFDLAVGTPSDVLVQQIDEETSRYFLVQVSGRERRPLSESALQQDKAELLSSIIDQALSGNLETSDFWRGRVPEQPVLDPKFLAPPTPTPPIPATPVIPLPTEES